jgi:hypothetical protein
LRYREVEDDIKRNTFKHCIAESMPQVMKRLLERETADGAGDEQSRAFRWMRPK